MTNKGKRRSVATMVMNNASKTPSSSNSSTISFPTKFIMIYICLGVSVSSKARVTKLHRIQPKKIRVNMFLFLLNFILYIEWY